MASITINDLPCERALDRKAMSAIKGAGASWVFGWIAPFVPGGRGLGPVVSFYQVNNFYADQMINQFQIVDIRNSAPGAVIDVTLDEAATNTR